MAVSVDLHQISTFTIKTETNDTYVVQAEWGGKVLTISKAGVNIVLTPVDVFELTATLTQAESWRKEGKYGNERPTPNIRAVPRTDSET